MASKSHVGNAETKARKKLAILRKLAVTNWGAHEKILKYVYLGTIRPGPEVIKLFSCSTQLSTNFQLLIKTKIPTNKEVSCFKSLKCIYHANKC